MHGFFHSFKGASRPPLHHYFSFPCQVTILTYAITWHVLVRLTRRNKNIFLSVIYSLKGCFNQKNIFRIPLLYWKGMSLREKVGKLRRLTKVSKKLYQLFLDSFLLLSLVSESSIVGIFQKYFPFTLRKIFLFPLLEHVKPSDTLRQLLDRSFISIVLLGLTVVYISKGRVHEPCFPLMHRIRCLYEKPLFECLKNIYFSSRVHTHRKISKKLGNIYSPSLPNFLLIFPFL